MVATILSFCTSAHTLTCYTSHFKYLGLSGLFLTSWPGPSFLRGSELLVVQMYGIVIVFCRPQPFPYYYRKVLQGLPCVPLMVFGALKGVGATSLPPSIVRDIHSHPILWPPLLFVLSWGNQTKHNKAHLWKQWSSYFVSWCKYFFLKLLDQQIPESLRSKTLRVEKTSLLPFGSHIQCILRLGGSIYWLWFRAGMSCRTTPKFRSF